MSNNKQSSVTELYNKIMQYVPIEYHCLVKEEVPLEQYEAIHKVEIVNAVDGFPIHTRHMDGEEYYNEIFGGKNE